MPVWAGATTSYNTVIQQTHQGILSTMRRVASNFDYNDDHYDVLVERQTKTSKNCGTL